MVLSSISSAPPPIRPRGAPSQLATQSRFISRLVWATPAAPCRSMANSESLWRDRTAACSAKDHLFHLIHVRKGVQLIEQYGRSLKVEAGDCLLIDCLAGFEFDFPQGVEALVLEIRRDWLRGWLPAPEDAVGLDEGPVVQVSKDYRLEARSMIILVSEA